MKKLILIGSIFLILFCNTNSQSYKYLQSFKYSDLLNVNCQRNGLYYLFLASAGQYDPYIYKSTDYGYNWEVVYKDLDYSDPKDPLKEALNITRLYAKDSIIILGADSGYLVRSYDYGKTWVRLNLNSDFSLGRFFIRNLKFAGSSYGIASTSYKIYLTEDNWKTFKEISLPDSMSYKGTYNMLYNTIAFPDENTIYISGNDEVNPSFNYLMSSFDRGKTWEMQSTNYLIYNIVAYDRDFVIAQGMSTTQQKPITKSILYSTDDKGKTWNKLIDTIYFKDRNYFRNILNTSFLDKDNFAFSLDYFIFRTTDRGKSWFINENKDLINYKIQDLYYYDKDSIIFVTNNISDINYVMIFNPNAKSDVEDSTFISYNISFYPNPVKDYLNIKLSNEPQTNEELEIYDLMGQLLLTQNIDNIQTNINIRALNTGIYYCKLKQNGTVFKFEVVK